MTRVRSLAAAYLILTVAVLGCSKNPNAPARLSGSVSYKGQPVKGGSVQFHTPEGTAYNAILSSDGTYAATDIPEGELVITVETESVNPAKRAAQGKDAEKRAKMMQPPPAGAVVPGGEAAAGEYTKIHEKYANPKTSPLTVIVKSGRQVHNIEMD